MRKGLVWGSSVSGLALVGFVLWGWIGGKSDTWWGAVGQWFGAIGSIVSAGVAVGIALESWRRSEKERDDRDRIQARLVFSKYELPRTLLNADGAVHYGEELQVQINNRSGGDILDATIVEISYPQSPQGEWREVALETFSGDGRLPLRVRDQMDKHTEFGTTLRFEDADGQPQQLTKLMNITISFIDADGRQWFRRDTAEPQRSLTW
jgi:hypothetical protein